MPSQKRKFGDIGEKIAEDYLLKKNYKIIGRNYWKPWGEIDLIAKKDDRLVFIEVKTRDAKNTQHYLPEYSINRSKVKKLQKICETYLWENKAPIDREWQIDVVAISINRNNYKARINHIENAVWEKKY
ncbi:MAG: YraN family protein [bacterium]|nr:YraN family protein [bacterium]